MAKLKYGYTTGACAAAAAKAAVMYLFSKIPIKEVEIPFPDKKRVLFLVDGCRWKDKQNSTVATVIKNAGDDPDVTNGASIEAEASITSSKSTGDSNHFVQIHGGKGVGVVTKRGLAVDVGQPAINPVPRKMIYEAVKEALSETGQETQTPITITISIPDGEELAEKTLNKRLGIIGGLSILGTTGIVKPVSSKAWTDTISTSMDVAKAAGLNEIILSTGRSSEKAVAELLMMPEESLIMMGDYLKYSLVEANKKSFATIHLAGMWAKIIKCACGIPQTHVRNGALDVNHAIDLIESLGALPQVANKLQGSNTAREIYGRLLDMDEKGIIREVCLQAQKYATSVSGLVVHVYLVDASGTVVERV